MLPAIILFALPYVLMIAFGKFRLYIALVSGLLFIVSGMLPMNQIIGALDFNVLLMIGGTIGLVQLFIDSRMPELLADIIMDIVPTILLVGAIVLLIVASFLPFELPAETNGLIYNYAKKNMDAIMGPLKAIGLETLGGNCTPIGASANIAGIGILRKEGYEVANADFFKIGIPFTMAAVIPAYILIWILFGA